MRHVDSHHHVWNLEVRDQPWTAQLPAIRRSFSYDELAPSLERNTIDSTVVVQTVCVPDETPELLALAAADSRVCGVVGWADLQAQDVSDRLSAIRAMPGGEHLVGIRHQVQEEADPRWLARLAVRRGLTAVSDAGLVYDLVVHSGQLPMVLEVVRALPHVRFVLDHGGKPPVGKGSLDAWRADIEQLGRCPNALVKLSGLATEAAPPTLDIAVLRPYFETLLNAFGPERMMFGSDWPVCLLAGTYDETFDVATRLTDQLSMSESADVFGSTAVRAYGL